VLLFSGYRWLLVHPVVKRPGPEAAHSHLFNYDVKNAWNSSFTTQNAVAVWCLIIGVRYFSNLNL
jgi:hypothetical protein